MLHMLKTCNKYHKLTTNKYVTQANNMQHTLTQANNTQQASNTS